MPDNTNVEELELSDAELIEVLKNHDLDRRWLLKVFGVGAGVSLLGGTAAGQNGQGGSANGTEGRGRRIDEVYGAPYSADEDVPSGLVDHLVRLHVHGGDAAHEGFPVGDGDDGDDQDDLPEFFFDPVGLHVKPGEIVNFNVHNHLHTVTSFHPKYEGFPKRVPTDHALTSPPVADDDSWLYRFTTKGVYDLMCLPHLFLGMVTRIVVFDPEEDDIDSETFDEWGPLPPIPNADAVLTDDALDPANIVEEGEVAWADLSL